VIVKLTAGPDRLEIDTELGGRLSSLVIAGRERLMQEGSTDIVEPALATGSYVLAPFVGRLSNGLVEWNGRSATLPLNHGRHAIHGSVFDVPWSVVSGDESSVVLGYRFDPARWPFAGTMSQRYAMKPGSLTIEAEITAEEPMPAAIAWHPWFRRDSDMSLMVQSGHVLALDHELIPSGKQVAVDDRRDLRKLTAVGDRALDDVYVAPSTPSVICWSDLELRMDFSAPITTFVVYTNPKAICLEPMTAWPDAVRLSQEGVTETGLTSLEPGQSLKASTDWVWKAR
jgi:aldose 1-epimerase